MTAEQFVRWAEAYYGEYKAVVKAEVLRWLEERPSYFVAGLREQVRDGFSNQYKTPPDIAIFNKYRVQATYDIGREIMALEEEKQERLEAKEPKRILGRKVIEKDDTRGD